MIIVRGGITTPQGFFASGIKSGIKKSGNKDLALIASSVPAVAAAAFTTNAFKASPVTVSMSHIKCPIHRAIIMNSGNANCGNGKTGDRDAVSMTAAIARLFGTSPREVLVASTGIIGKRLPIEKIIAHIPQLAYELSPAGGNDFATAIMTTDTVRKECAVKVRVGKSVVTIGGACKGVGMIHPQMRTAPHATLLAFITTDCAISKTMLQRALSETIDKSFNMVSVDGDMSTNDSCFVLANGLAANRYIRTANNDYRLFLSAFAYVMQELAKMLARDGEGATKFVEITVKGARTSDEARAVARKVSTSNLLKCCIFGQDPNWGRVIAAAGASGVPLSPSRVDIFMGAMSVMHNGMRAKHFSEKKAHAYFKGKDIVITLDLKMGRKSATAWTCDFSHEYVSINSEYST